MKQEQNAYYGSGKYQPIDIIDYYHMDFNLANAVKYVIRAGNKPGEPIMKDMDKAKDYILNFKKHLKINTRIMYELRGYYSVAENYIEYIDFVEDLKESGLKLKALNFVELVVRFYREMYYTAFPVNYRTPAEDFNRIYDAFIIDSWNEIEEAFNEYYTYCEGISKIKDDDKTTLHSSNGQSITLYTKESEPIGSDTLYRKSTKFYEFVIYGGGYKVLIPTSSFFEITSNITNEVIDLYKDIRITRDRFVEICTDLLLGEINYNYGEWISDSFDERNKDIIGKIKEEAILRFKSDYADYFKKDGFLKKLFK